jgi:hypothetical protein
MITVLAGALQGAAGGVAVGPLLPLAASALARRGTGPLAALLPASYATKGASAASSSAGKAKPRGMPAKAASKAPPAPATAPAKGRAAKPKPPRALSAYILFLQSTSGQWFSKGAVATAGMARAGAAWKAMSDAEKVGGREGGARHL